MAAAETKRASKGVPGTGLYQPPAMRAAKVGAECSPEDASLTNSGNRLSKSKRPDMQVYVPRARRQVADSPPEVAAQNTPPPPKSSKIRNSSPSVVTPRKKSASKSTNNKSKALCAQSLSCDSDTSSCDLLDDNNPFTEEEKQVAKRADNKDIVQTKLFKEDTSEESPAASSLHNGSVVNNSDSIETVDRACVPVPTLESASVSAPKFVPQDLSGEEDSWDALFDDSGECLDPSLMNELTKTLGKVKVEQPSSDYSSYEEAREKLLADTDYSHVLEVYGFASDFKTQDLMAVLNPHAGRAGFDLKWVDDTHALAIFSNSLISAEVLSVHHALLKVRPLSQATAESKSKAKKCPQTLRPYRPRPETCSAMAKRMVSSALGVKLVTSKEEREKEKNMLKEAREKKRLAVKQSEDAWEGKIGSCK